MKLDTRVISSLSEFDTIAPEWNGLLGMLPTATPFHTYEWAKANLIGFGRNDPHIITFRESDGTLVGILPMALRHGRKYLRKRCWLEFTAMPYADYGGAIVQPGYEATVARYFAEHLDRSKEAWDGVFLERLPSDDEFGASLLSWAKEMGLRVVSRASQTVRQLSRREHRMPKVSRSREKAHKKLAKEGSLRFDVFDTTDGIASNLETFFALHIRRFAAKKMQSPLADPSHREFFRCIVGEMGPRGYVWLSILRCNENPVAMRLSLRYGNTLHLYASCFAQQFNKYSPSTLQLRMLLDHAFAHAIETVDFGIGESPHKEQAGATVRRELSNIELYSRMAGFLESNLYDAMQRAHRASAWGQMGSKLARLFFPYDMKH